MNSATSKWLSAALALLAMLASTSKAGTGGLFFDGVNDYVTFGAATNINNLGVTNFTIECWFKRQGAGKRGNTGSGGFFALPLVTKGMAENEAGRTNMNYFFGIGTNSLGQTVLAADFEDCQDGLNHPIRGNTVVGSNIWVHGAVTYDVGTSNWALYVNGALDMTTNVLGLNGTPITNPLQLFPRFDSIQHAALASCLRANGNTNSPDSGFFAGSMDEVRLWNVARSAAEIAANYNLQITSDTGLIARWGLDESSGITLANSVGGGVNGRYTNGPSISTATWTNGYFAPPAAPTVTLTNPLNNAIIAGTSVTLEAAASDTDGTVTNVQFYLGATLLGNDTTSPYSFVWNGVPPGPYALKAVATDNSGMAATSAVVNVAVTPPPGVGALYFDGINDYVTMAAAQGIGVSNFTIECWFKQQGPGKRGYTGTGGLRGFPLVTRGMAEGEAGATNMNYFFGIGTNNAGQQVLVADFEDSLNGLNHPIVGSGTIGSNVWIHAAVTYDVGTSNWSLYVNGALDATTNVLGFNGSPITNALQLFPRFDSIQHAALGSCLRVNGGTNADTGFFAGTMDEVRIWNYARTAQNIADHYQSQIPSATGLIARWTLDDGTGLIATNGGTSGVDGTLVSGPAWVEGYFVNHSPIATNDTIQRTVPLSVKVTVATLLANDTDPDGDTLTILSVAPGSANGTVTLNGAWVFYTPNPGFNGNDTFTYTLSDGQGGTAIGTVAVNVTTSTAPSQNMIGLQTVNDTNKLISLAGIPGLNYRIEATTNIASPAWETIGNVTAGSNGLFEFVDTNAWLYASRLYRSAYP